MASDNNQSQQRLAFAAVDDGSSIEIDSTGGSDTSDNAEESSLTTMSLSESVRDFAFENDRRYHKFREGTYQFPNDEPEQAREDMKHAMIINLCNGKLHYAPLHNPKSILDIGTGTGIWAIDSMFNTPQQNNTAVSYPGFFLLLFSPQRLTVNTTQWPTSTPRLKSSVSI